MEIIGKIFCDLKYFISNNAAIIIASLALAVSIYESIRRRQHDRLSVRPWLQFLCNVSDRGNTGFILINNGVGPSIITEFKVLIDDELLIIEPFKNPWESVILKCKMCGRIIHNNLPTPYWLPAKEKLKLFVLNYSENEKITEAEKINRTENINSFIKNLKRIEVKIKYQSCYAGKIFRRDKYTVKYPSKNKIK